MREGQGVQLARVNLVLEDHLLLDDVDENEVSVDVPSARSESSSENLADVLTIGNVHCVFASTFQTTVNPVADCVASEVISRSEPAANRAVFDSAITGVLSSARMGTSLVDGVAGSYFRCATRCRFRSPKADTSDRARAPIAPAYSIDQT